MSIRKRLAAGFLTIGAVLVLIVILTGHSISEVQRRMDRLGHESVPVAAELAQLNNQLYATLAALRGWLLTEDRGFERERTRAWASIDDLLRSLDSRSRSWLSAHDRARWAQFKITLDELHALQGEIASIAHTADATPATRILIESAQPLADRMYSAITLIIDEEKAMPATGARKQLLGVMADLRGSTTAGFATLRTYLLTGDRSYFERYRSQAHIRDDRLALLAARRQMLSEQQQATLDRFLDAYRDFTPLPEEMLRIRSTAGWHVAQHKLATEAMPHADSLLAFLAGATRTDGSREGGVVATVQTMLVQEAKTVADNTGDLRTVVLLLLGLGIIGSMVIVIAISRSIIRPISALGAVVDDLTQGDMSVEVPGVERGDELGDMARAIGTLASRLDAIATLCEKVSRGDYSTHLEQHSERDSIAMSVNSMVDDFQGIVAQARLIGAGDYSVDIAPKSETDTLGVALAAMTHGLRDMSAKERRDSWMRVGQREIAEAALGENDLRALSRNIVTRLSRYVDAQVGVLYAADDAGATLGLAGSYAFTTRKHLKTEFQLGDGLVGQAALERQRILLTQVPDDYISDYIHVTSGLGNRAPKHLLVVPLLMGDQLKGVVELGKLDGFADDQCELVELVADTIAIAINTAQNVERMERLIAETKRQALQLTEQSEELRATNEELEEQRERLLRSREELQAQSEALRVSNEELEEKAFSLERQTSEVASKNRELELARQALQTKAAQLEQNSKYKSEFLANMSHELRTPLNSVLILAKLLVDDRAGNLTREQAESAAVIHSSGQDLLRLIDDILDLSKVEAGMLDIIAEPVDIASVCARLGKQFAPIAEARRVAFDIERTVDVPDGLHTDRVRVEQILKNLLANAFKFTDSGGVRLVVHQPSADAVFASPALSPDQALALSVIDTGIGISMDKQAAIFEAFQQADGSTSRKYGGTGLGLTISRELTRLLGGELQLRSKSGEGSTFTLYLPLMNGDRPTARPLGTPLTSSLTTSQPTESAPYNPPNNPPNNTGRPLPAPVKSPPSEPAESAHTRSAAPPGERAGKLLLVIEDNARFAETLVKVGRDRGYQCLVAYDGTTGLQLALDRQPDAIILDLGLPRLNGLSVLEQLKFHLRTRHIPVHIISGQDRGAEGLRMGAIGHLVKPVSLEGMAQVFARVERYIERRIKSVLLVEDDPGGRDAIVKLIASDAIHIAEASTGEQAIAALQTDEFECVILDLGLPDTTGFDLLRTLHADPALNLPPIIVYTGREISREEHLLLSELASSIVVKGASSPERLLDEVSLFLHSVEGALLPAQRNVIRGLHDPEQVLRDRKVLLVDDNLRNSFALSGMLKTHGVKVVIADDGQLALDKLASEADIELVIMDIMMPGMDGYETICKIRQRSDWQTLPIIALTAKAMAEDRARCLEAGANDYLTKPVDTDRLVALMRVWLFQSR